MRYIIVLSIASVVMILDQVSKWWAMDAIPMHGTIPVIDGFFNLVHIYNRGAAFGFLNRSDIEWQFWLFFAATITATIAIYYLVRTSKYCLLLFIALGLVLGGALGNLIDRIRFRAVMDFLDFYIGQWHWPAFNVADVAICIGAILTCIAIYINDSEEKSIHESTEKIKVL